MKPTPETLTQEQKDAIVKAVCNFAEWSHNVYVTAKEVQDVFIGYTQHQFEQDEKTGELEFIGGAETTSNVLFTARRLNDFFFDLQEALDLKPQPVKASLN